MKNGKNVREKIFDAASIISSSIAVCAFVLFLIAVFVEAFANQPCTDLSTCYALVIFLAGIIVALKIRLLDDGKRWVELVLFIIGSFLNASFILVAFIYDCQSKGDDAIKVLNAAIWMDFVILMKSLLLVIALYFKKYLTKQNVNVQDKHEEKNKQVTESNKDLFEVWLGKKEESALIKKALTDTSYRNVNHELKEDDTNFTLATYGDAVLKLCLSEIFFGNPELSKKREKYESDKYLVSVIANHYHLLNFIDRDSNDQNMKKDYLYDARKKKNNPHKFIATAVEAMIGAIYKETNDLKIIIDLISNWTKF